MIYIKFSIEIILKELNIFAYLMVTFKEVTD